LFINNIQLYNVNEEVIQTDLKDNIRELRIRFGMSQADLGRALGISAQGVSKWETGKSDPDRFTIMRMCELFNTSPDQLYGYTPQPVDEAETIRQQSEPVDRFVPQQRRETPRIYTPTTSEARILARGMDRMPEADRKRLLRMVDLMFEQYAEFFEKGSDDNDA